MKMVFLFCAFMTSNAFAGGADFDSYLNANAHNPVLTKKTRNQEAFAPKRGYYPSQDPKVAGSKSDTTFKMGGTNTSGSFGGGSSSGSPGAGSFKPTAVTTKPVTLAPTTAPAAQATNSGTPEFGTVGVNPTNSYASSPSASGSSGATSNSTVQSSGTAASTGDTNAYVNGSTGTQSPADAAQAASQTQQNGYYPSAYRGTNSALVNSYVNQADQIAQQRYDASQATAYQAEHGYYPSAYNNGGGSQTGVQRGEWVSDGENGLIYNGSGYKAATQPTATQRQPAAAAQPTPQQTAAQQTAAQQAAAQAAQQAQQNAVRNILMMMH
jgi:hypothetical protein